VASDQGEERDRHDAAERGEAAQSDLGIAEQGVPGPSKYPVKWGVSQVQHDAPGDEIEKGDFGTQACDRFIVPEAVVVDRDDPERQGEEAEEQDGNPP
jgi:hypothetical protein